MAALQRRFQVACRRSLLWLRADILFALRETLDNEILRGSAVIFLRLSRAAWPLR
ncbi:hypothetical protein ABIC65_002295 [Sphingomonas trueperi]|uniref:hypothetical protein n=1 Tax=Sphingomonas trueperi TaxID=53317 RepID=UPI0033961951